MALSYLIVVLCDLALVHGRIVNRAVLVDEHLRACTRLGERGSDGKHAGECSPAAAGKPSSSGTWISGFLEAVSCPLCFDCFELAPLGGGEVALRFPLDPLGGMTLLATG